MRRDDNQLDDFFGLKTKDAEPAQGHGIKESIVKNVSFWKKLRLVPKALSKRERYAVGALLLVLIGSLIAIPISAYFHFTQAAPDFGGRFSEGVVGEPRHINPLLSQTSDTDRDILNLVYSGLFKYNSEGKIVPDLAQSYEISSDGLNYTVYLKEGVKWHDGRDLTADDVIFTVQIAQSADYGSPLRIYWQGVTTEKVNDHAVIFKLSAQYAQFLNNLTLKIMPRHIWQDIRPINFALSEYNVKPVGSGPYKFDRLLKDQDGRIQTYQLIANENYHDGRPYIDEIEFKFYATEDEAINAYNRGDVDGIGFVPSDKIQDIKFKQRLNLRELELPRYFAVFFNQSKSTALSDKNVRLALNYATDKNALVDEVLDGRGIAVNSPMMGGGVLDIPDNVKKYDYDLNLAKETLGDKQVSVKITTSSWPELTKVADVLKKQWEALGVNVTIEVLPTAELQQAIKERNYEALLFGAVLTMDPDPFSLWHSSQKRDPGLNLALYDNQAADALLEQARQTLNPLERAQKYTEFQNLVVEDVPAVFLYNPLYIHGQTKKIKGAEGKDISLPSDRFADIEKWYIETKRVFKSNEE